MLFFDTSNDYSARRARLELFSALSAYHAAALRREAFAHLSRTAIARFRRHLRRRSRARRRVFRRGDNDESRFNTEQLTPAAWAHWRASARA